jgi:TonB family protein
MVVILAVSLPFVAASVSQAVSAVPTPRAPLQTYVTPADYPAGLPRSAARPVEVALVAGPDGRVTECRIVASSGASQLDNATCRLLRSRVNFLPARNAAGSAVSGEVRATIDWGALPVPTRPTTRSGESRITLAPWESVSRLRARLGQVASCQWQTGGVAPPPRSSNACENPGLSRMALGMAAENKVDLNKAEVVVTLRMTANGIVEASPEVPSALVDLAADLEIGADGRLKGCRFVRQRVRTTASMQPDCRVIFAGPYVAGTDRSGRPVASTHRAELRVEAR